MVKRNPPRNRRVPGIELFMECTEEPLSASQVTAQQVARYQYDQAIAKIRDAQAKARVGKATIINKVDTVGKVTPQVPQRATPQKVISSPSRKEPERSSSPDIIFVGETPPSKPKQPVQQQPQPRSLVVTSRSPNVPPVNGHQPKTSVSQQVYKLVTNNSQWVMKPIANVAPQQQTVQRPGQGQYGQPVGGTYGMGYKRPLNVPYQQDQVAKKKPKKNNENEPTVQKRFYESDDSGNWVPLDEYYYGKMEGEPTYEEEKGEFRFKCWYCNKMLYNNVKAMMHIQGHIDSSKQQNIDLSDLTQCKHCYKQFDTPFEMQTHVDKVHMSNTNVLLCRICDRDHESRNALTHHMRMHHNACEMPYTCQLCKFRSSMYSDVVDHFKKKHDSSQHLLCLYCLRVFVVKFVSQGWGTTQTYYGHLLKHQSKAQNKKCGLCRLAFFNAQEVKAHKLKHHGPNQKAVLGTAAHSSKPDQVLIKIPSSSQNKHCVKSLNAPAVSKVLDFGGTTFPGEVHYYNCFECKMSMGTHDHYRKYVECSMCRFATICSIAYANHMMGFHSGQMSSLNLNIPWERKMSKPMYCLCGFSSSYGNKIANHLVFCMKSSCYENRPEGGYEVQKEEEESDPRHKPGASLLDALGLVKRRTVTPRSSEGVYGRSDDHSPPKVDKSPPKEEVKPKPSPWDPEPIPPELQGSRKWSTVRLKDSNTPTKESVFLGDGSKDKEPVTMDTDDLKEKGISEKGDNSDKQTYGIMGEETDRLKGDNSVSEMIDEDKLLEMDNENKSAEKQSDETNDEKTDDLLEEEELLKDKSDEKDEIDNDNVHKEDVQKDDEKLTENNCQLNDKDENNKTVEKESDQNESVTEDSEPTAKSNSPLGEETVLETESTSQEHSEHIEDDESSSIKDVKSADDEESLLLNDNQAVEDSSQKEDETGELSQNKVETEQFLQKGETEESSQKDGETVKSSQKDDETEESSQKDGETEESLQKDGETEESSQKDGETEESSQKDGKTGESSQKDDETEESSQKDGETEESLQKDDETEESLQKEGETGESSSPVESTENKDTESQHKTDETKSEEKEDKDGEPDMESDKQDNVKEGGVSAESTSGEMEQDSHEEIRAENTNTNSDEQSVDKGDNSETTKQENEESAKADNSKDLGHGDTSRDYHGNKSHDQRSYDDHRSRSHDHRSYEDHRSRSHDHRSYDDRRSHDRNHYDDRRHYDRQDDRNRYRRQDDRNYDRGYHDNRGYRDHRDNRDYHRDDRRHNRGQGSYQGHGGYGGGYHGYR